eukprot:968527-Prorocentrum_minimum.AAC.2
MFPSVSCSAYRVTPAFVRTQTCFGTTVLMVRRGDLGCSPEGARCDSKRVSAASATASSNKAVYSEAFEIGPMSMMEMLAAKPNPSNNLVASRVPLRLQRVGLRSGDFDGRRIDHEHRPPGQPDFALIVSPSGPRPRLRSHTVPCVRNAAFVQRAPVGRSGMEDERLTFSHGCAFACRGVEQKGKAGWNFPPQAMWPEGTKQYKDRALQSPFIQVI